MANDDVSERIARLERRATVLTAIAVVGVGLGAVGLYAGLRTRPRASKLVLEDAQGKLVLTPTFIGMQSKDERRFASIMLDDRTRSVTLRLEAGDAGGQVVMTSTSFPDKHDTSRGVSSLELGDAQADAHVRLTTLGTADGPSLSLGHGRIDDAAWGVTSFSHSDAGPVVSTSTHGGSRHAVLQLEADTPPTAPPVPAGTPSPAPSPAAAPPAAP